MQEPPTRAADLFVSVDGERLRYRDEGQGPAVILLHGWTLDLEMWRPQVSALHDRFRLIRLDRRGHGRSEGTPASERDGADLAALCSWLKLTRVALLAMSQGVRGAVRFAARASIDVAALILDGPPRLDSASVADASLEQYAALARTQGIEAFRREWARHPLMQLRSGDAAAHALLAAMIARYPAREFTSPLRQYAPSCDRVPLESLRAPTLVLSGAHDLPGRRRAAIQLASDLPDAELVVIPGAGHLPNLDCPDTYNRLCRTFLTRHLFPRHQR